MCLLKGSVIRKRYILVYWEAESERMDRYLYNYYQIKRKYKNGNFSIYLCNQLNKMTICKIIKGKGGKIISVSGTIKKCKKSIMPDEEHKIRL
jgi:RNase P/RNase MRP subunit POP5